MADLFTVEIGRRKLVSNLPFRCLTRIPIESTLLACPDTRRTLRPAYAKKWMLWTRANGSSTTHFMAGISARRFHTPIAPDAARLLKRIGQGNTLLPCPTMLQFRPTHTPLTPTSAALGTQTTRACAPAFSFRQAKRSLLRTRPRRKYGLHRPDPGRSSCYLHAYRCGPAREDSRRPHLPPRFR
jgi:hypothetical protein